MQRVLGIDLGTTYSAISIISSTGIPEVLKNREGEEATPSVVLFQEVDGKDEPLVGSMAKHSAALAPESIVQFVKRFMGDPHHVFTSSTGTTYRPEETSALILKKLKEDAELALGEPVRDVVITVPAYFDDARRTATKQAGAIAGLNVLRLLNEPTAAALAFGISGDFPGTVLVYDLGGGTFDVTLLSIDNGSFDVIGTDGDRNLGGFDFDNELMTYIAGEVVEQGGPDLLVDPHATADLREKAEMAKRSLTNVEKTSVHLSASGVSYRVQVSREIFELRTKSLLQRTQDMAELLLERHNVNWQQIDHVLLVGGSTRMPMVRRMVEQISGTEIERGIDPDLVVALGAAVQGGMTLAESKGSHLLIGGESALRISDVTSQALGVITLSDDLTKRINSVVIPRDAKVPAKHTIVLHTVTDQQANIEIKVTEGDDPDPRYVQVAGEKHLPITPRPKDSPFQLTYAYDIDQVIFVELVDLTSGESAGTFEVDRQASLPEDQVKIAATKINSLTIG